MCHRQRHIPIYKSSLAGDLAHVEGLDPACTPNDLQWKRQKAEIICSLALGWFFNRENPTKTRFWGSLGRLLPSAGHALVMALCPAPLSRGNLGAASPVLCHGVPTHGMLFLGQCQSVQVPWQGDIGVP